MNQKQLQTTLAHPTPELPVEDVERAQQHYRDVFGFEIGWLYPGGGIGAVSRENAGAIFFRRRTRPFEPAVHWVFAADIDATYEEIHAKEQSFERLLLLHFWCEAYVICRICSRFPRKQHYQ